MYPAVAVATSEARICACSSLAEMKVVERGLRFQFTTAPDTKFAPYKVSMNAPLPGTTACGLTGPTTVGTGLLANADAARRILTRTIATAIPRRHIADSRPDFIG